jgi:hypothetical protein
VDVRDERGNTLLIVACQNGNKVKEPANYMEDNDLNDGDDAIIGIIKKIK